MGFNWAEYLSIAEGVCGMPVSGPSAGAEAQQRAAVSRAYYAAFVSSRNRLRDLDGIMIPPNRNPHQFVASQYQTHPDPGWSQIGVELHRLRLDRNRCDYEDVVDNLPRMTQRSLDGAARVLAALGQLPRRSDG